MGNSFPLKNKTLLLTTEAPGGIYNAAQLKKIAALCDSESVIVKATEDQRLAVFVPEAKLALVKKQLEAIGLGIRHYQDGLHQPTTCIGEMCPKHEQDALGTALDLTAELDSVQVDAPLKIGINGCSQCCVPTHTLDISIIGDTSGYRVNLGGKSSQIPEMAAFVAEGVPAAELPGMVRKVVDKFRDLAEPGENLQQVMERCGVQPFVALLAPYSQDAAAGEDPFAAFQPDDGGGELTTPSEVNEGLSDESSGEEAEVSDFDGVDQLAGDDDFATADELETDISLGNDFGDAGDIDIDPQEFSGAKELAEVRIKEEESLSDDDIFAAADFADAEDDGDAMQMLDEESVAESPVSADEEATFDEFAAEEAQLDDDLALETELEHFGADEESLAADLTDEQLSESGELESVSEDSLDDLDLAGEFPEEEVMPSSEEISESDDQTDFESFSTQELLDEPSVEHLPVDVSGEEVLSAEASSEPDASGAMAVTSDEQLDDFAAVEDLDAEVLDGDAADLFEEKLNESIAEEEMVPVEEDANEHSRLEAMRMVETASLSDEEEVGTSGELDASALEAVAFEAEQAADQADLGGDYELEAQSAEMQDGDGFQGVEVSADGQLVLHMGMGTEVVVDTRRVKGPRTLRISGQEIKVTPHGDAFRVEVDGIAVVLPKRAA